MSACQTSVLIEILGHGYFSLTGLSMPVGPPEQVGITTVWTGVDISKPEA